MAAIDLTPRPAKTALTATAGFLSGFTHTVNPYIGCRFQCDYCYVQGSPVHLFHQPRLPWGEYAHPRTGIAQSLAQELARFAEKDELNQLAVFMSSATDPYQGLERQWRLTRACLEVLIKYPPALLIVQTRSPLVQDDYYLLQQLGQRCWLNFTIETDLDAVRQAVTPRCPAIAKRWEAVQAALDHSLNVQLVVSPCLPYSNVEAFGSLLLAHSQRVIVDTYISGDGTSGKRTAKTVIPMRYQDLGCDDWRAENTAHALYEWLDERIGDRAGWSQAGFTALAKQRLNRQAPI
jgi:DNA repair photolyase